MKEFYLLEQDSSTLQSREAVKSYFVRLIQFQSFKGVLLVKSSNYKMIFNLKEPLKAMVAHHVYEFVMRGSVNLSALILIQCRITELSTMRFIILSRVQVYFKKDTNFP